MLNAVWQVKIGFKKPTGKRKRWKTKKPGRHRAFMMDGLVSTRKFLSLHNIKNNFSDIKNFSKIFYAHFIFICGKGLWNFYSFWMKYVSFFLGNASFL